jgi:hypothetical protein
MLAVDRIYTLGGGYHWPSRGREFYEAGVVDGKTAAIAAGIVYTSSMDDYDGAWEEEGHIETSDTPVKRRANLALAYSFKKVALGISGGFVEASDPTKTFDKDADRIRGNVLGGGIMAGITPSIRGGVSVENLANRKVAFAAPTIYRAGLAWAVLKDFNLYVDLRRRETLEVFEASPPDIGLFQDSERETNHLAAEQALIVGGMARAYDLLRISVGTGVAQSEVGNVITTSGGLALVNKAFSLAYSIQRPDTSKAAVHHAVSLGLDIAM